MTDTITITGDNLRVSPSHSPAPTNLLGVNIEAIGYWRGSTPFANLRYQDSVSGVIVQKQPHLEGARPEPSEGLRGAIPITPTSALSFRDGAADAWLPHQAHSAIQDQWRDTATRFDFLRLNATALRLNEEGGIRPQYLPNYGDAHGISSAGMAAIYRETMLPLWYGPGHLWSKWEVRSQAWWMARAQGKYGPRCWWEFSNEPWNGAYPQGRYYKGEGDFLDGMRRYASEAETAFAWVRDEYGKVGAEPPRFVLNAQFTNPTTAEVMLEVVTPDVLAVAPYFSRRLGLSYDWKTESDEDIFNELALDVENQAADVEDWKSLADTHGCSLAAYEAGPHLFAIGAARHIEGLPERLESLMLDPRMEITQRRHLELWREATGGAPYCVFALSGVRGDKNGYAGVADFTLSDPLDTPRGRGLLR